MELNRIETCYYFRKFIKIESVGAIILIVIIVAFTWANSPYYESYHYAWLEFDTGVIYCNLVL